MGRHHGKRNERGSALVELTLVLPLFVALLLGIFTCGNAYFQKISVVDAARGGARYGASLQGRRSGGIGIWRQYVKDRVVKLSGGQLVPADVCVDLVMPTGTNTACGVERPPWRPRTRPMLAPARLVKVSVTRSARIEFLFSTITPDPVGQGRGPLRARHRMRRRPTGADRARGVPRPSRLGHGRVCVHGPGRRPLPAPHRPAGEQERGRHGRPRRAGRPEPGPWSGVCRARAYLKANSPGFSSFDAGSEKWLQLGDPSERAHVQPVPQPDHPPVRQPLPARAARRAPTPALGGGSPPPPAGAASRSRSRAATPCPTPASPRTRPRQPTPATRSRAPATTWS